MEKFAVISDIHGNLPALDATLADIKTRNVDKIICLGDIIGKGPNSAEAVDICKDKCDIIVKGNWEDYISNNNEEESVKWYRERIGIERLKYLNSLPLKIEFYISGRLFRLFHAHPESLYTRTFSDSPIEKRLEMFKYSKGDPDIKIGKKADIIGYGDIHNVYIQYLSKKILFNVGSVGNPLDIPESSYAIIEGKYNNLEESAYSVQFIRVPYDIDLAIKQAVGIGPPKFEAYINELKTAKYSRR